MTLKRLGNAYVRIANIEGRKYLIPIHSEATLINDTVNVKTDNEDISFNLFDIDSNNSFPKTSTKDRSILIEWLSNFFSIRIISIDNSNNEELLKKYKELLLEFDEFKQKTIGEFIFLNEILKKQGLIK